MSLLPRHTKRSAFTLTEMMIVLVILGVLAALAINQFYGPREKALEREAMTNLKLIAAAEKIYRMEVGFYVNGNTSNLNDDLNLMLPEQNAKWEYQVTAASGSAFTGKARRSDSATVLPLCINESNDEPYSTGCSW